MSGHLDETNSRSPVEGSSPSLDTPELRREAIDLAFDYRGDVTVHTADGRVIEGYLFDRDHQASPPFFRVLRKDSNERLKIASADLARLVFSGRDTAAGKSWETWVRKYQEKRARGEAASIESENLE